MTTEETIKDVLIQTNHKDLYIYLEARGKLDFIFALHYFNNDFELIFLN